MTILFYCIESVGLGHVSRMLGIAEAIRELKPKQPMLFVTEANDARLIEHHGFPFYQVRPRHIFTAEEFDHLPDLQAVDAAYLGMMQAIFEAYQPRLTIHDTHPRRHIIEMATEYGSQQAMILRTRTDMDSFVERNAYFLSQMALIAFPHTEREIGKLDIPGLTEENYLYCGPLLRRTRDDLRIDDIRAAYNLRPGDFTIVVTNGGGNGGREADQDDFLSMVLDVFRRVEERLPPFRLIVISGPLNRRRVIVPPLNNPVMAREFEPCLFELMAAANLVIARGGYNTMLELQELGVPAICVPAERSVEDQGGRIRQVARQVDNLRMVPLDARLLAAAVHEAACSPGKMVAHPKSPPDEIAENKHRIAKRLIALAELL